MNENIIVKMKFGSHLYGTATIDSDLDIKGVFLPSKEQILLGKIPKTINYSNKNNCGSKNTKDDVDYEFYSLHYFIKLACDGQTVAMDMLHAPSDMIMESSKIWDDIVKNRHRFYTKNLKSFIDYARSQASKYGIKGSRIDAVKNVLEILKSHNSEKKLRTVWEKLPRTEHCHDIGKDPNGINQYQVCGKAFQETALIGYVIPILEKYYDEYGKRAKQAFENKNIDWKAVSHALRAAYQTKEIFTENKITFPLRNAPFLLKVKKGELDYLTEVAPVLESLMTEVEELVKKSQLPDKVDMNFWNDFISNNLEETLFKCKD